MQLIYILFIVIIFLQNEHMFDRYKLNFIILGFGGLIVKADVQAHMYLYMNCARSTATSMLVTDVGDEMCWRQL